MQLASLFSTLGILISIGLFFSPIVTLRKSIKTKKIENISLLFVVAYLLNAFLWVCYGIRMDVLEVLIPNSISLILQSFYVFIFVRVYPEKLKYLKYIALMLLAFFGVAIFLPLHVLGFFAMLVNVFTTVSLAERIIPTIRSRDPKFINLLILTLATINCACWMIFALFIQDMWIMIPNAFGVIVGLVQFYVFMWAKGWAESSFVIIPLLKTCFKIEKTPEN